MYTCRASQPLQARVPEGGLRTWCPGPPRATSQLPSTAEGQQPTWCRVAAPERWAQCPRARP